MLSNFFVCKPFLHQQQAAVGCLSPPLQCEQGDLGYHSYGGHADLAYHISRQPSGYGSHGICSLVVRSSVSQREALETRSNVVSDQNVPEGHKGLHGFLYGDGGAEVHSADSTQPSISDDGTSVEALDEYITAREGSKIAGVFSLYNSQNALQYVGYSRNVIVSLRSYLHKLGKEMCSFVRVKTFADPAMITRNRLEEERQRWLSLCETPPPGNSVEKDLWEGTAGAAVMSESEKIEYEEKKLKMRKAMGENLHDEVEGEEDDARTRRLKLLQAVEGDDWSNVIDGQTKETASDIEQKATKSTAPVVSPFDNREKAGSSVSNGLYSADTFELTIDNVDLVLNDVRPYLIADGGNVEVVSVENGIVSLRLQGACGTCPSSTVTMKMGIERVLKEKFADAVKEVVQVDQQQIGASIQAVNAHLDILRPAIHNYGGSVEVVSVENGECKVKFKGPPPIGMGIQAAVKDKFPDVTSVVLIDA
eukprot:c22214_g1_i1 orf=121-1554(+)